MTRSSQELRTHAALLALAAIWGINFPILKAVLEHIEPLALNALRFPVAAGVLALLLPRRSEALRLRREDVPRIVWLAVLGHGLYQLAFIKGIDATLAGNASLLLATTPVWALILSVTRGHERTDRLVWAGVGVTVAGMGLVVLGGSGPVTVGGSTLRGDLLMVGASVLWALYTVGGRRPVERYGSLRLTAWTLWAGTPLVVAAGVPQLRTTDWSAIGPWVWVGMAYSAVFAVAVAYLIWYRGVRRLGTARTAAYSNLVPVAALLTAWLWLGEVPAPLQLVGAGVVLAGLTATRKGRARQLPEPSSLRWRTSGNS